MTQVARLEGATPAFLKEVGVEGEIPSLAKTVDAAAPIFNQTEALDNIGSLEGKVISPAASKNESESPLVPALKKMLMGQGITSNEANVLIAIAIFVAEMKNLKGESNEADRHKLEKLKLQYQEATRTGADFLKQTGSAGLVISLISMTIFLGQFGFANQGVQQMMKHLSEQSNGIGGLFTASLSSKQKIAEGEAGLALNQLSAEQTRKQSESGADQDLTRLLDEVKQRFSQAARSNG